jgi:hypothetical protein
LELLERLETTKFCKVQLIARDRRGLLLGRV